MIFCVKHGLLLCVLFITLHKGYANSIDSLATKEDVRKFLFANLRSDGIIFLSECADIYHAEINTNVFDCGTGIEHTLPNFPLDEAMTIIDKYPFHFYKADIDGNGLTDLVVDAGIVIIVMDMGYKFEGHMFSDNPDWNSYSFRDFISLPDGSIALSLRHNYNSCLSVQHLLQPGKTFYVTDSLTDKTAISTIIKIDTLYKIHAGIIIDSQRHWASGKIYSYEYADTVDMKLYNMTDTIIYKFNGFVRYNHRLKHVGIAKINYYYAHTSDNSCWATGSCIEINKNGECFLQYEKAEAYFTGKLDSMRVTNIFDYTSYEDMASKKNLYLGRGDVQGQSNGEFTVYFDDGTVKRICILACSPALDFGYLSKNISEISKTLLWHRSEKQSDLECGLVLPSSLSYIDLRNYCECR